MGIIHMNRIGTRLHFRFRGNEKGVLTRIATKFGKKVAPKLGCFSYPPDARCSPGTVSPTEKTIGDFNIGFISALKSGDSIYIRMVGNPVPKSNAEVEAFLKALNIAGTDILELKTDANLRQVRKDDPYFTQR